MGTILLLDLVNEFCQSLSRQHLSALQQSQDLFQVEIRKAKGSRNCLGLTVIGQADQAM